MNSRRTSLEVALNSRNNALNAVRLVLASLVIVSHVGLVYPAVRVPELAFQAGGWAVSGFFIISGYLIAGSRAHLHLKPFFVRRCARIYPAYWVQLIMVAAVAAPLAQWGGAGEFTTREALSFVWKNASLRVFQWEIGTTPPNFPSWNASLWTLVYEFAAYVTVALVFSLPLAKRHGPFVSISLFVVAYFVYPVCELFGIKSNLLLNGGRLATFFLAGVVAYYWRSCIPVRRDLLCVSALVTALIYIYGGKDYLAHIPLAYMLLVIGATWGVRWGSVNDISYGVYIYAFPIQHLLGIYCNAAEWGYLLAAAGCLVATIPIAWASWVFVERPIIKWARRVTGRSKTAN